MDDKISELSIKQRLKQIQTCDSAQRKHAYTTPEPKVYAPEQYNYFSYTIDKEIQHQGNILHRIKKQIQDFKAKRKTNARIKNQYEFDHKSFTSKVFKKHRLNYQHKKPETVQSMNVSRKSSERKSSGKLIISNITHLFQDEQQQLYESSETPFFTRSGVTTPLEYFEQSQRQTQMKINKLLGNKQNFERKSKVVKRLPKTDEFSIVGSQPLWKQFQSYYKAPIK